MINIRPMTDSDVDSVCFIEEVSSYNPWTRKIFKDCLSVGYVCWVLEKGNTVIGFAIFMIASSECHVLNIAITPSERECGYGRFLMEHIIRLSCLRHVERVLLEVRTSNLAAINLYKSLGFLKVGVRKNYYKTKQGREDAVLMNYIIVQNQ